MSELIDPAHFESLTTHLADAPRQGAPVVYPLAGRGERFPFAAPEAEGFWLDADRARPLGELVGAVGDTAAFAGLCEGVAFVERLCVEHLGDLGADVSGTRTISGGATRNPWWNQRRADALGVPLHRPHSAEPAFGMAVLARASREADGGDPDLVGVATEMVHLDDVVEPRTDPALDERYERFRDALTARGWTDR